MRNHSTHLADEELLRAVDRELPSCRQAAADAHLASCPRCRARGRRFDVVAAAVTSAYRHDREPFVFLGDTRQRLQAALRDASARMDYSWRFALQSAFPMKPGWTVVGAALATVAVLAFGLRVPRVPEPVSNVASVEHGALPVRSLTPGATLALSVADLCAGDAPRTQRRLPAALRQEVLHRYGMERVSPDEYELDYLITPELGGASEPGNLWPQRYGLPQWNARVKDQLEARLPQLVCSGQVTLATAQREIAVDWVAAYRKYFNTSAPLPSRAELSRDDDELLFEDGDDTVLAMAGEFAAPAMTLALLHRPLAGPDTQ
jgi:anti-sigma factor RsiW